MTTSALPVANVMTDYGAVGNGIADDTTAFQNAINGAWGTQSPDTVVNNRILWIPAGTYKITAPLAMVNRLGTIMMGAGSRSSILSFQPTSLGNSVTTDGLTPCIAQDGVDQCSFRNFGIVGPSSTPDVTICGFDHWNSGSHGSTSQGMWENMYFNNLAFGIIAADPPGANCENGVVTNCVFDNCTTAGLYIAGLNTLNWRVTGGTFSNCSVNTTLDPFTTTEGNSFGAIAVQGGGVISVVGTTFDNNTVDMVNFGSQAMGVEGGSSTSPICFISTSNCPNVVNAFHYRPAASLNCDFIDCTWHGYTTVVGCKFDPQADTGIGFIGRGNGSQGATIFDGLTLGANAGTCEFAGSFGLYDRGCNFVPPGGTLNPNLVTSYTGTRHSS